MLSASAYKSLHSVLKRPVALTLGVAAFVWGIQCLLSMNYYDFRFSERNDTLITALFSVCLIVAFDYAFILGNRMFPMNFSMADCTYHFSGPFSKWEVVKVPFGKALIGMLFFVWFIDCQAMMMTFMFDINIADMLWLLGLCMAVMLVSYFLGVALAVLLSEGNKYYYTSYVFLGYHLILIGVLLYMATSHFHVSIKDLLDVDADELVIYLGDTWPVKTFPVAGWLAYAYKGYLSGNVKYIVLAIVVFVVLMALLLSYLMFGKYDFYDRACSMATRANDFREARKAGVDMATTSLAVDARVGREKFNHGWGVSAIFYKHIFENIRTSKIFFVNQAAFLFRVVCAGLLLLAKASDDADNFPHAFVVGAVVMLMIFNTVAFTGGRTILEFNRPFIYMIPASPRRKLFACIFAEIPEIFFDSLCCGAILWLASPTTVTWGMFFCFLPMIIAFDFFCEILSLVCVRTMRGLGRYTLLVVKYVFIIIAASLVTSLSELFENFLPNSLTAEWANSMSWIFIFSAILYGVLFLVLLRISRYMLERYDA